MHYSDRRASPKCPSGRSAPFGDRNSDLMSARENLMSSRLCLDTLRARVSQRNPSEINEFGGRCWAVRLRACQKAPHASASTPCRTVRHAEDRRLLDHPIESKAPQRRAARAGECWQLVAARVRMPRPPLGS